MCSFLIRNFVKREAVFGDENIFGKRLVNTIQ